MAKNPKQTASGTNVEAVKQRNQAAKYGTEFASETDAQEVRKQNQKSQQNKK